ncbi:hypothetical protein COCNU_01G011790 [Cocos nucifera]|uniref:Uncharacterized protein n=1 Tax=Cocos nucifera TaxID=13894 RepID=A0A8K0HW45_COCNU|nr:hypothetical protein COCNU_01G011790 [Cocos nucifera]
MVLVPIPLLAGFAIAGILKDTATELSPDLKEGGCPGDLLLINPHFANGGLWRTIWFALMRYRVPQGTPGMASEESAAEQSLRRKEIAISSVTKAVNNCFSNSQLSKFEVMMSRRYYVVCFCLIGKKTVHHVNRKKGATIREYEYSPPHLSSS